MTKPKDAEDRRQQRLRRLGTQRPICVICGESDPVMHEWHHIAGRQYHDDQALVCVNHHRKLSDMQLDHVPLAAGIPRGRLGEIGRYLLGLADLLEMIAKTFREFGTWAISASKEGDSK